MDSKSLCDNLYDEILSPVPLSPSTAAHVSQCPECQALRKTIDSLRDLKSVYPPATLATLKAKVMKTSLPPVATGTAAASLSVPKLIALAGAALIGGVLLLKPIISPSVPVQVPRNEQTVSSNGSAPGTTASDPAKVDQKQFNQPAGKGNPPQDTSSNTSYPDLEGEKNTSR